MEFDKSKVYTVFNADEVKVGSEGYFADFKTDLISFVKSEDNNCYHILGSSNSDDEYPFITEKDVQYRFFYLVEEAQEPKKRPCTREELVEMLKKQGLPMLRFKESGNYHIVNFLGDIFVTINCERTYTELCEVCTLLDGTPLWVEE